MNIAKLLQECTSMPGEEDSELIQLDSLMPVSGYINTRKAVANFEAIVGHVKLLPTPFLDCEGGWTLLNLPFLANERGLPEKQWGEQDDAMLLCLVCQHFGIFQDPLKTLGFKKDALDDLSGGMSYVSFNVEPQFLDLVRRNLGLK